jgi:acetyl esterase/lipase
MPKYKFLLCLILFPSILLGEPNRSKGNSQGRFTVLGLGDSITEGGDDFQSYLFPLWEKLFTAGYSFDFIGPRSSKCRIGTLNHAGYSGKTAEFLDLHIDSLYRHYQADIVLLHAGHNHFESEKPVNGIIAALESVIYKILKINPHAKILVAQVISSGKLPKYSYLPDLNHKIADMVRQMRNENVLLVNQSKDFDWQRYTISDKVHPNEAGANKMAQVWFDAMKKDVLKKASPFTPTIVTYKTLEQGNLKLHIFKPEHLKKGGKHAAIVYFFGGGWTLGTPLQFYRECAYYASKGMVAVSAEYRISYLHHSTPFQSVEDARDVIRWLRENAQKLNLDPNKIAAAGASAGGHLAAATGIINSESTNISSRPNLLLLYYPVIDNSEEGYGPSTMKKRYQEISPLHNIGKMAPPALFILGTKDALIPVKKAEEFKYKMEEHGVYCELHLIENAGHPIFYYSKDLTPDFYTIRTLSDNFLKKFGFLEKTR